MILLIDNYDSFTYNLYQFMGIFTDDIMSESEKNALVDSASGEMRSCAVFAHDIMVVRNDKITLDEIREMNPERIVLSPGPKSPKEAGICLDVVREFYDKVPMLGICLGHQSIGEALGGTVSYAKKLLHGKQSVIEHSGTGIFAGVPSPLKVARYHSLAVQKEGLPDCLEVLAETEDGEIMAMRHREYPVFGLQFHPESIYTEHGKKILENFLEI
ncbi:MAG: aminodeoxychorismate/anthranilate synthase component II [Lachnospiraceae bacterium]|nr:aminodeoxychorismate/anthranilate synthase component II [Lachnospiraceae bacterium]